jgi:hypothetical protein
MKRLISKSGLITLLIVILMFFLINSFFVRSAWSGGICLEGLEGATKNDQPYHATREFGVPIKMLLVTEDGCFEERLTSTEWYLEGVIVNFSAFYVLGFILNYIIKNILSR